MKQLIYVSTAKSNITDESVQNLITFSKKNNSKYGITGFLVFDNSFFLQCIEGKDEEVNSLMKNIEKDKRHSDMEVLGIRTVRDRSFENWNMGYLDDQKRFKNILLENTGKKIFSPYQYSYNEALDLLLQLSETPLTEQIG